MDLLIFAHLFNQNRVDMAFEATKRELGELYTFFRLLADGKVFRVLRTPRERIKNVGLWR